jgi:hypothetical protein
MLFYKDIQISSATVAFMVEFSFYKMLGIY